MSWEKLHTIVMHWSDLNDERPFHEQKTSLLLSAAEEGLSKSEPDLELATLSILELEQRKRSNAASSVLRIKALLHQKGHQQIPWLMKARRNLRFLKFEDEPKETYKNTLYVILRKGYPARNGRYGIYVGETQKTAEERLKQHLTGIRAGRGLPQHGIQLMYSLMWPWQKVPGGKRLIYETALHKALAFENTQGPMVTGNTQPYDSWPKDFQNELFSRIKSK